MNDVVKERIDKIVSAALTEFDAEILKAEKAVEAWSSRWGSVPDQPILKKPVQQRVRRLIEGEEIEDATEVEKGTAGAQWDKILKSLDL